MKNRLLLIILFLFAIPFSFADECDALYSVVDKYYDASQKEDFASYISVMDTDYIYKNLASKENYEVYVKSAFGVYDINDYEIDYHKCVLKEKDGIVFLNLDYKLSSNGSKFDLKRDYVVVMRNVNNAWKIQFVMDLEEFANKQNMVYELWYLNETKDVLIDSVDDIEEADSYSQNMVDNGYDSGFRFSPFIIVLLVIFHVMMLVGFIIWKKKLHHKLFKKDEHVKVHDEKVHKQQKHDSLKDDDTKEAKQAKHKKK